jgi:hypothetical protein
MKEALGYLGFVLLATCAGPLVLTTIQQGHANGIDSTFLALWLAGEVAMLGHVSLTGATFPIRANYVANTIMVSIISWYKWVL